MGAVECPSTVLHPESAAGVQERERLNGGLKRNRISVFDQANPILALQAEQSIDSQRQRALFGGAQYSSRRFGARCFRLPGLLHAEVNVSGPGKTYGDPLRNAKQTQIQWMELLRMPALFYTVCAGPFNP